MDLQITHHWDNTVSEAQSDAIQTFLEELNVRGLPFEEILVLENGTDEYINVKVECHPGRGEVFLSRPEGGCFPIGPQFDESALMRQVDSKINSALKQLETCRANVKILALNVDWPTVMFTGRVHREIYRAAKEKSPNLRCFVFNNRQFFDSDCITPRNWKSRCL